jgi:hypothetical protein
MRRAYLVVLLMGCSSSESPTAVDTGVVEEDADAVVCPPALGTAKPRTMKATPGPLDETLHVNHLQLEATHNSYHLYNAGAKDWRYGHAPLTTQLDMQGVRGVELDTHWNAACGRYEVYHLTTFDEGTTCRVFVDCLQQIRNWSDAHPSHHPLFIQLEPKDDGDEPRFLALEKEILSVFTRDLVITPDDVRGSSTTLREAVTTRGWPTLKDARGRVLFYIDRHDKYRDDYTRGRKDLNGRLMFADADPTDPFAAVLVINNAFDTTIPTLAKQGFIIRTFADKSLSASLANDRSQLTAALASGAHILSTDFPAKIPETEYFVTIPEGTPSRCNPVTAPTECKNDAL